MNPFLSTIPFAGPPPRVLFCESFDQRILRAAHTLNQHRMVRVALLGQTPLLEAAAVGCRADLAGMDIIDYEGKETQGEIRRELERSRKEDFDPTDPVVAGACLTRMGRADTVIAGAAATATYTMRVFLKTLGMAPGCKTMSGFALVAFANCPFLRHSTVGMADVSAVPDPGVEELADIAIQSALSYERILGAPAKVAFLSFSSAGSSRHPAARKITEAVELTRRRAPDLTVDGEMQLDTALIPAMAGVKAPSSPVAGNANVLVFPSLNAGNIAIKALQDFSGHRVIGPILQGLARPATYIPRGSSAEDIVDQVRLLTGR